MRIYVLNTSKTTAPGKVGDDGKYLYNTTSNAGSQKQYDGTQEERSSVNGGSDPDAGKQEPEEPIAPSMSEGEQAAFFENTANWDGKIRAWVWSSSKNYTGGSWPGVTCTYLGNNIWKWCYTGTDKIPDGAGIIFNNGSSQTADMTWCNGGYYNANGYVKTIDGAGEIPEDNPVVPDNTEKWTAYYKDTNWGNSTVYAYVWDSGDSNREYLGSWPGKAMTRNNEGMWYISLTPGKALVSPMIIFNNGQGGNGNQTADLVFFNNGVYNYNGYLYTGVEGAKIDDMTIYTSGGVLYVVSPTSREVKLVRADGVVIYKIVHEGTNAISDLARGFYIVENRKVIL